MAQSYGSYLPGSSRVSSPSPIKESGFTGLTGDKQLNVEEVQEAYVDLKDRLVNGIDSTKDILGELKEFNGKEWVVRYPHLQESKCEPHVSSSSRGPIRRTMTMADDPSSETEVMLAPTRKGLHRSMSLVSVSDVTQQEVEASKEDSTDSPLIPSSDSADFQILRLDLKLGPNGSSTSAASLVSQLEKSSIANLLEERIAAAIQHLNKLRLRVEDTSSKVLVTGDLNSGKSTFVNALLRREIMPVDQQPCTTAFCEVHDATENGGLEEVHVLKEGVKYDIKDESTFSRAKVSELEAIVGDNESQPTLKLYLGDSRAPSESLLNNGVVDISLIDAPGLNRDSIKTTALFARQEEIDVVVFVVSAENHFTLSSREFLWNASNEKAYVFVVVNKFEQIKNKEKCKRLVLEQIKQFSPRTYEDAADLVHFVDSAAALQPYTANPAFDDLEASLRSFVLVKRSKSKLQPATTYLSNVLADIDLLASANAIVAQAELVRAKADLEKARPILEKMKEGRDVLEDGLDVIEDDGVNTVVRRSREILHQALDRVGDGKLGVTNSLVNMPSYPGLLGLWDYAKDVRKALLRSLDLAVLLAEDEARVITTDGVSQISKLADDHLPEGVERTRRVFMPEAMFSVARASKKSGKPKNRRSASSSAVVAGGIYGLGIGLAKRPDMLETTFFDIFDVSHQFWVHFGDEKGSEVEGSPSALSVVSVGVGALTMVGGQALGMRGVVEGIVRVTDLFGNETARKWAAPVLGAATIGLAAYLIIELPSTIPRTVGRRIRASLVRLDDGTSEDTLFLNSHSIRTGRETRKVLRLASWDLRERFRSAYEERQKYVKQAEDQERTAMRAKEFFSGVQMKTGDVRDVAGVMDSVA